MIDFELEFQYAGEKSTALRKTRGKIPRGRCVVLCGGSGCGKSTLLRCINGLIPQFYEGERKGYCRLAGQDTDGLSIGEIGELAASVVLGLVLWPLLRTTFKKEKINKIR